MRGTQAIERAVALLRAVSRTNHQGATVAEIASQVGLDRTTTHRMLASLAIQGLLSRVGEPRRYVLGPLTCQLGRIAAERVDLYKLSRPALTRLAAETRDTVFLMVRDGFESVCVERESGTYPIKTFVVDVGTRRPLGIGAGSLAILTALPPEEAELAIRTNARSIATYEGLSAATLRAQVLAGRGKGRASMDVVRVPGVHAVAVPICDAGGVPLAAFSIAAIHARMTPERRESLFQLLEGEARSMTAQLSGELAAAP